MNKIQNMLELQHHLNTETNGEQWVEGITKDGRPINWGRCMYLEVAELVNSFPWKHWHDINKAADIENVRVEIVDIWHFLASELIYFFGLKEAIEFAKNSYEEKVVVSPYNPADPLEKTLSTAEEMMRHAVSLSTLRRSNRCNATVVSNALIAFRKMAETFGMTLDKIYPLYIGKNVLNVFRQEHGYKEGTYTKEWNGKEDNVVMMEILDAHQEIDADRLYRALEEVYPG